MKGSVVMPPQTQKSPLAATLGNRIGKSFADNKDTPLDPGNQRLPAGIENGVARLDNCRIAPIKEGKFKDQLGFYADGVALHPIMHEGTKVAGMRTSLITIPICDLDDKAKPGEERSAEKQWAKVQMRLRLLCQVVGEHLVEELDTNNGDGATILENAIELCKVLQSDIKPFFRFRTWKGTKNIIAQHTDKKWYLFNTDDDGKPTERVSGKGPYLTEQEGKTKNPWAGKEPMVNNQWGEAIEYEVTNEPGAMTEEVTTAPSTPKASGNGIGPAQPRKTPLLNKPQPKEPEPNPDPEGTADDKGEESNPLGGSDLDQLVKSASDDDGDAQARLKEIALEAGMTEEECDNTNTWQEMADMITAKITEALGEQGSDSNSQTPPDMPPVEPSKNQLWKYKPKGARRALEMKVLGSDKKTSTVSLQCLATKTTYKGVPWDQLESVNEG